MASQCVKLTVTMGHFDIWDIWDLLVYQKMSRSHLWLPKIEGNWRKNAARHPLQAPFTLQLPLDTPQTPSDISRHSHDTPDISLTLPNAAVDTHKHSWHSTDIFWHPHFSQSPSRHPLTTQMPLRLYDECFVKVKAVPGGEGDVFGVPEGVLECPEGFGGVGGCTGGWRGCLVVFSHQFPSIYESLKWNPWHFLVDLEVPNVSNIKMSHSNGQFDTLGSHGKGLRGEL